MSAVWSAVVLTQGDRPAEVERALASLAAQVDVTLQVVVVGNGWEPSGLPAGVDTVHVETNVGAPEGRNRGLAAATGDLMFFLDDDAWLPEADTLTRLQRLFAEDPALGVIQTRIESPEGETARRWVPRLRDKDPYRSSRVFSVLEGSVAVRREVIESADGWAGPFFYAHEGVELAWRAWDAGFRVEYRGDLVAHHPLVTRSRHERHMWQDGRNRVWLAKRNLPQPLAIVYVADWAILTAVRSVRHPRHVASWASGAWAGVRTGAGERRTIAWRTVRSMAAAGRPPIV